MSFFIKQKNRILLIMSFFFLSHTTLVANGSYIEMTSGIKQVCIGKEKSAVGASNREVSLDTFGGMSMTIVLVLTSLLGLFFVRDELEVL